MMMIYEWKEGVRGEEGGGDVAIATRGYRNNQRGCGVRQTLNINLIIYIRTIIDLIIIFFVNNTKTILILQKP